MTQDLKTKLIREAVERFDEMNVGCCCGDFCEGQRIHNQKIKDNLATEIDIAVEKTILDAVLNVLSPLTQTKGEDK